MCNLSFEQCHYNHFRFLKYKRIKSEENTINMSAIGYPHFLSSSGIISKFIP